MAADGWRIDLNDTTIQGGTGSGDACLLQPPEGTDVPDLVTTDQTYPQQDGVEHFSDWYSPRILTALAIIGDSSSCACGSAIESAQRLAQAWDRQCEDIELVLWTGCEPTEYLPSILPNGNFSNGTISGWNSIDATIAYSTAQFRSAPGSLRAAISNGFAGRFYYLNLPIVGGTQYRLSAWLRAGSTTRTYRPQFNYYTFDGTPIGTHQGSIFTVTSGAWVNVTLVDIAPNNAGLMTVEFDQQSASGSGEVFYCDDVDLFPLDHSHTGPFGIIGRPRVAKMPWRKGKKRIADGTFRFDSVDHRLYILGLDGTPGSGGSNISLGVQTFGDSLSPAPTAFYPLSEGQDSDGQFVNLLGTPDVDFDPTRAVRGFPAAHYAGISDGLPIGTSTFIPQKYTGVGATNFFKGVLNSATIFTFATWYKSGSPTGVTTIAEFNSPLYFLTTRLYSHNGTTYALSAATSTLLESGDWHHVAIVTSNGIFTKVYVDGVLTDTLSFNGVVGTAITRAYIAPVSGFYSEMALFSTALSQADIADIAQILTYTTFSVAGNLCVPFQITFTANSGGLDSPRVYFSDGSYVGIDGTLLAGDVVVIDTSDGTATRYVQGTTSGASLDISGQISGDPMLTLSPGANSIAFRTESGHASNAGQAVITWRPAVLST